MSGARIRLARVLLVGGLLLLPGCDRSAQSSRPPEPVTLTVFVAASLAEAMTELAEVYAESHDVRVVFNFAGSGTLARQLLAAPRADLFISADEHWMDAVEAAGRIDPGSRGTLLSNRLVVVAHREADFALEAVEALPDLPFAFLSVGDPAYVPAGRYAREWLEGARCGDGRSVWSAVAGRLAPAMDVRAALQQVAARRDAVGIVYRTDALSRPEAVRILFAQAPEAPPAIRYPAAVVKDSAHRAEAGALLAFLRSERAREIFARLGFSPGPALEEAAAP